MGHMAECASWVVAVKCPCVGEGREWWRKNRCGRYGSSTVYGGGTN